MIVQKVLLGKAGEKESIIFLQKQGFYIIARNFRTRYAEIDIIAQKDGMYYFVEVKTRSNFDKGLPYEAVNSKKLQKIRQAGEYFVMKNKLKNPKLAILVISVILNSVGILTSIKSYEVDK